MPKSKTFGGKRETSSYEDLLVYMVAANGGARRGQRYYKFFSKLDDNRHLVSSFQHAFRGIAAKATDLLAAHSDIESLVVVTTRKKSGVGCKRKVAEGEGAEDGEEGGVGSVELEGMSCKKKHLTATEMRYHSKQLGME